ncbi:NaeI family type II restriction endonuclease [Noviherbaspirillum autotrophicum]|uniref:NaeI family type II restriction endonuclease n=1 Tax=Noviherbaspirillum autotrophicum TaxID=709839 RepID=UPI0006932AC4|nr:NaeI family type II restriction endonuclease [Noviherbaspirillum autotrophicum]
MSLFPECTPPVPNGTDPVLNDVYSFFTAIPDLASIIGKALRQSFDEVIDGPRTGRYCIEQLEKTEKTYIGTKVEIVVRDQLSLQRGDLLDNKIRGHEVDTKFSLSGNWMIPREAVGHICLLISGDDNSGVFNIGLLRMTPDVLTGRPNQDGKKSVSAAGKQRIRWVLKAQPLERNFLLDLSDKTRDAILSPASATGRIHALFRNVTGKIIPRSAILQVAQSKDPLKRARESKAILARDNFLVLCSAYLADRVEFDRYGFHDYKDDDWLSIRL